jgi:hypothetical protein
MLNLLANVSSSRVGKQISSRRRPRVDQPRTTANPWHLLDSPRECLLDNHLIILPATFRLVPRPFLIKHTNWKALQSLFRSSIHSASSPASLEVRVPSPSNIPYINIISLHVFFHSHSRSVTKIALVGSPVIIPQRKHALQRDGTSTILEQHWLEHSH